ncbi:MAG: phosphatidate cytidylyltransferase [Treponema sp.]|nr:phosphatidate cytidylyltransferase [Treponema sp.]
MNNTRIRLPRVAGLALNVFPREKFRELRTEIVRKSIHFLIALSPLLASYNRHLTMLFLMAGTLFYVYLESLRLAGVRVPFVSAITSAASRFRDQERFVLGPVTLGLGALLALLLYPSPAASIAIYALAFGDGFASLAGKLCGQIRPRFLFGKSLEGSCACFIAVCMVAFRVSGDLRVSCIAALTAAAVEALPLEDLDNLAIPVTVGLVMQAIL